MKDKERQGICSKMLQCITDGWPILPPLQAPSGPFTPAVNALETSRNDLDAVPFKCLAHLLDFIRVILVYSFLFPHIIDISSKDTL